MRTVVFIIGILFGWGDGSAASSSTVRLCVDTATNACRIDLYAAPCSPLEVDPCAQQTGLTVCTAPGAPCIVSGDEGECGEDPWVEACAFFGL